MHGQVVQDLGQKACKNNFSYWNKTRCQFWEKILPFPWGQSSYPDEGLNKYFYFHFSASLGCPLSHPFAYLNGDYCCKKNKEKVYPPEGAKCDGSSISIDSTCCVGDDYVRCPIGAKKCGVKQGGEKKQIFFNNIFYVPKGVVRSTSVSNMQSSHVLKTKYPGKIRCLNTTPESYQ